jgi:hypothetical protein
MALRAAESDEDALSDERGINNLGRVFNGADVFTGVFYGGAFLPALFNQAAVLTGCPLPCGILTANRMQQC